MPSTHVLRATTRLLPFPISSPGSADTRCISPMSQGRLLRDPFCFHSPSSKETFRGFCVPESVTTPVGPPKSVSSGFPRTLPGNQPTSGKPRRTGCPGTAADTDHVSSRNWLNSQESEAERVHYLWYNYCLPKYRHCCKWLEELIQIIECSGRGKSLVDTPCWFWEANDT